MGAHGVKRRTSGRSPTPALDRFELYELAVTDAARLVPFLRSVHGGDPRTLREDFCGSGALARHWPGAVPAGIAIAVDADARPLKKLTGHPRLKTVHADVREAADRADIIAATNFPLGYWHSRAELLAYLRHARGCLKPSGIFIADIYGGVTAFTPGSQTQRLRGPSAQRIDYAWEQVAADPLSGRVHNAIHFRVTPKGASRAKNFRNAFTYDWRLWSIPELRDAMLDAGFKSVEVYDRVGGALDQHGNLHVRPLADGEPLDDDYVVYVVGRRGG